jgi:hypothetical protein
MSPSTTITFLDFTSAYLLVKVVTFDDHINFRIYETYLEYLVSLKHSVAQLEFVSDSAQIRHYMANPCVGRKHAEVHPKAALWRSCGRALDVEEILKNVVVPVPST